MSFVHLHCHSEGSLLDGMCRVKDMVRTAAEMGMPAVGLTDHGVMYNVIEFYQRAREAGVKPIVGCELYVSPRHRSQREPGRDNQYYHMLALARNETGYKNLVKLVSKGFLEGFYYKPRVDRELLAEYREGLIITSACLGGEIPQKILKQQLKEARHQASELREIFGPENFYLELQNHGLEEQDAVNRALVQMSRELKIPLVCSNDVHYLRTEDARPHEVLLCIQTGTTMNSPKRLRYGPPNFFFASPEEMARRFAEWPETLENTLAIAARCDLEFDFSTFHLPHYEVPSGYTYESYLEKLCRDALPQRYREITPEIEARLRYELEIIQTKGFSAYFLIVWDCVRHARSIGIMSQARGSAAGSLVSYLLGLTVIDPMGYNLLFERFLTRERKSMPDIDLDFADDRREEIIQYVRDKYGEDRVAQIIAFGTMAAKAAVRDAGRALEIPIPEVDRVAKLIPTTIGMTIDEAIKQSPELAKQYGEDPTAKTLLDTARSVEGLFRHASTHAAGVVICKEPVIEYAPVQRIGDSGVTIQFDKVYVETIGLLKMDFLGLRNLTVVDKCLRLIERVRGIRVDLETLPYTDAPAFRLLQAGEAIGVFQLESSGMRKLLRDLKPDRLEDIIHLVALYRPGPLQSGMADEFVRRKHGLSPVAYLHPDLEPILKNSHGIILYQEQVMQIAMQLAGFSAGDAETLMKAMSKKQHAVMEKLQPRFIEGAEKHGVKKATAQQIWDQMYSFASYGFGLNHSAAYAVLTYHTAYLKANFPHEFMATNLSSIMDNKDRLALYIEDCRRMKIDILAPDINESEADFTVHLDPDAGLPDAVRFGLAAIKNVSRNAIDAILRARADGPFTSVGDFARRVYGCADGATLTRPVVECLIKAGAFDRLEPGTRRTPSEGEAAGGWRAALLAGVERALAGAAVLRRDRALGQNSLFGDDSAEAHEPAEPELALPADVTNFSREELLAMEKDLLGVYVSDHPLRDLGPTLKRHGAVTSEELKELGDRQEVTVGGIIAALVPRTTKKGLPMASITLEDLTGSIPVTVFPKFYEQIGGQLAKDKIVLFRGKTSVRDSVVEDEDGAAAIVEVHAEAVLPFTNGNGEGSRPTPAVHVRLSRVRGNDLHVLRNIFAAYPGDARLLFHIENGKKTERVLAGMRVQPSAKMLQEVQQIVGRGTAWVE
jgi:DNA polymerase III subunit alpha